MLVVRNDIEHFRSSCHYHSFRPKPFFIYLLHGVKRIDRFNVYCFEVFMWFGMFR